MENNKLAALIVTSIIAILNDSQIQAQNQHQDSCTFETTMKPFETRTCNQCNQPTTTKKP